MRLTEHETLEEEVDPAHDDHLGDHHHHLRLHLAHHTVHSCGVGERVRGCALLRVAFGRAVFEVGAIRERLREVLRDRFVVGGRERRVRGRRPEDLGAREGARGDVARGGRSTWVR